MSRAGPEPGIRPVDGRQNEQRSGRVVEIGAQLAEISSLAEQRRGSALRTAAARRRSPRGARPRGSATPERRPSRRRAGRRRPAGASAAPTGSSPSAAASRRDRIEAGVKGARAFGHRLVEQVLLRADVRVERALLDPHRLGEIADRGAVVALLREQPCRLARQLRAARAHLAWRPGSGFGTPRRPRGGSRRAARRRRSSRRSPPSPRPSASPSPSPTGPPARPFRQRRAARCAIPRVAPPRHPRRARAHRSRAEVRPFLSSRPHTPSSAPTRPDLARQDPRVDDRPANRLRDRLRLRRRRGRGASSLRPARRRPTIPPSTQSPPPAAMTASTSRAVPANRVRVNEDPRTPATAPATSSAAWGGQTERITSLRANQFLDRAGVLEPCLLGTLPGLGAAPLRGPDNAITQAAQHCPDRGSHLAGVQHTNRGHSHYTGTLTIVWLGGHGMDAA